MLLIFFLNSLNEIYGSEMSSIFRCGTEKPILEVVRDSLLSVHLLRQKDIECVVSLMVRDVAVSGFVFTRLELRNWHTWAISAAVERLDKLLSKPPSLLAFNIQHAVGGIERRMVTLKRKVKSTLDE